MRQLRNLFLRKPHFPPPALNGIGQRLCKFVHKITSDRDYDTCKEKRQLKYCSAKRQPWPVTSQNAPQP